MHAPQPAPAAVIGYGLHGLHALRYEPDELTAAMAWYLAETQLPDGSWPDYDVRPPMEEGPIVGTALTLKALQYYPPSVGTRPLQARIEQARRFLERSQPVTLSQRAFRHLGLGWAGASPSDLRSETRELLVLQRPDGGWAPCRAGAMPGRRATRSWHCTMPAVALSTGLSTRRRFAHPVRRRFWWVKSRPGRSAAFRQPVPHGGPVDLGGRDRVVAWFLLTSNPPHQRLSLQQLIASAAAKHWFRASFRGFSSDFAAPMISPGRHRFSRPC
jgi:hypothetical protein